MKKVRLSFLQIWNMNVGFLGVQFSFGLQQNAIIPVWTFLGVEPESLPILSLAGPLTGLFVQPIIGAMSDKTWSPRWGRRRPYFLVGAVLASLMLFIMPYSKVLWVAVLILWILDIANNTTMEPYRAFVADKLDDSQKPTGYLMQSFFTGLGVTLASSSLWFFQQWITGKSASGIPYWVFSAFFMGAVISLVSILWSTITTPEYPPTPSQLEHMESQKGKGFWHPIVEIFTSIADMPKVLWQLGLVYLFQWYAMFCYWQYISYSVAETVWGVKENIATNASYEEAASWSGLMNGSYNIVTLFSAFVLLAFARKYKAKIVHSISLLLGGVALIAIAQINNQYFMFIPMVGLGIAWASMMGVPYIFIVPSIPPKRYGVYMGIVNMMIVIPMIIQTLTFGYVYTHFLGSSPHNAILFGGVFLLIAAGLTLLIKVKPANVATQ